MSETPDWDDPRRNGHPELPLDPDLPPSTPPHLTWRGLGLVLVGGVAGTLARYAVSEAFPIATVITVVPRAPAGGRLPQEFWPSPGFSPDTWPMPWGPWPMATFVVNIVGAFLLGVLLEALGRRGPDVGSRQRWRLLLGTGFLGAFTTYSALAVEVVSLARLGHATVALGYAVGSVVLGFLVSMVGMWVAAAHHRARRSEAGR